MPPVVYDEEPHACVARAGNGRAKAAVTKCEANSEKRVSVNEPGPKTKTATLGKHAVDSKHGNSKSAKPHIDVERVTLDKRGVDSKSGQNEPRAPGKPRGKRTRESAADTVSPVKKKQKLQRVVEFTGPPT